MTLTLLLLLFLFPVTAGPRAEAGAVAVTWPIGSFGPLSGGQCSHHVVALLKMSLRVGQMDPSTRRRGPKRHGQWTSQQDVRRCVPLLPADDTPTR